MTDDKSKKIKLTDEERHKRFVETAKKVDASDKKVDFDKAFDGLGVKSNPKPKQRVPS